MSVPEVAKVTSPQAPQGSVRNWLIGGLLVVSAGIIFGLLYLFVIAPSVPNGSVGWYLFSFATGLTMIVMPCTLPLAFVIVPLSMGKGMVKGISMALAFGLGVAFTLSLYGVAAALLGGLALGALGADLETLKNWVYFGAGIFALIFALSEIGLMNFHMPTYSGAAPAFIQKRQEILKAFFLGAFLGNVGVGCPHPATPLILIEIATSGDVLYGWTMFLIHAIGRVLPLLLLAFLAILGVNGLNWLMARKDAVERATGWAMVFVAGFILTLGLFSHKWWVNSGLHSGLETLTQEHRFNVLINDTLGTSVAHVHGLETGTGLFGLPLAWGSWVLVALWLIPMWWWYAKRKRQLKNSPAFKITALEAQIDRLERDRRQVESMMNMDELEETFDLKHAQEEIDALEAKRREEEAKVAYGETGAYKEPVARAYETRILGMQRNFIAMVSVFLGLIFIYYLPTNFYYKQFDPSAPAHHAATPAPTAPAPTNTKTPYGKATEGLPSATGPLFVQLNDGDSYDITAGYVKKELGNRVLRMLAYNGSIPGPFIKAKEGSTITINFTNNTDVDQTIHSHGVRLNNLFDGVPDVTQTTVRPGEKFSYTINFPDAGVAWYHPHTRDDYGQELGLYGNYLIESNNPEYWTPVNREIPLVVDDILIENNQIASFYKETVDHALLGRFGNTYLVNGEVDALTNVHAGEVIRFFVTNVSNARTYKLSIPGAQMKLVGADLGRFEQETYADSFLMSPAERVVVEVYFPKAGLYKLVHTMPNKEVVIAQFNADTETLTTSYSDAFNVVRRNSEEKALFDQYRQEYLSAEPAKKALLTVQLTGMVDHSAHNHAATPAPEATVNEAMPHSHDAGHDMSHDMTGMSMPMMNGKTGIDAIQWDDETNSDVVNTTDNVTWKIVDQKTGKENMSIDDWNFTKGQLVKIRFTNDAMAMHVMQHPIHFHGQRFLVLSNNGVPNQNMVWKDTALVPPGEYIDLLVDMSNSGLWMAHCHIVEHLFAGMMLPFRVQENDGSAVGDDFRKTVQISAPAKATTASTGDISYAFNDVITSTYNVRANVQGVISGEDTLIELSFTDQNGSAVNLSDSADKAVSITFVRSDDSVKFRTYPGNTTFPMPMMMQAPQPQAPASDGHNHIHYLGISTAYAHGDMVSDDHHAGTVGRTYSVPVRFPSVGEYKGFVEFILEGEATPRTATFMISVTDRSFSVDNFGWSPSAKWWILLTISILIMTPLSLWVRKYINKPI